MCVVVACKFLLSNSPMSGMKADVHRHRCMMGCCWASQLASAHLGAAASVQPPPSIEAVTTLHPALQSASSEANTGRYCYTGCYNNYSFSSSSLHQLSSPLPVVSSESVSGPHPSPR